MSEKYLQVLYNVDWPQSGSQTFQTWSEPDSEPGVWGSGSAEYLNPNLLAGSGSSRGRTKTPNNIQKNKTLLSSLAQFTHYWCRFPSWRQ